VGILITDDKEKAEFLNSYFTTIGSKLSDNLYYTLDESDKSCLYRVTTTCKDIVYNDKKLDVQLHNLDPKKVWDIRKYSPVQNRIEGAGNSWES